MAQGDKSGEVTPISGVQTSWEQRIQQFGQQAEQNLPNGAVTTSYKANRDEVLDLLNRALAGEWTAYLQYYHHYTMASGMDSPAIAEVWKEHADEEREHAGRINERINQLGGVPANSPAKIAQLSPLPFKEGHDMASQLRDDLVFERATISLYDEIIRTCGFNDNTTRRLFESLVADENEHAEELSSFLFELDASTGQQIEPTEKPEMKRRAA